jgi:hypothetical protein
LRCCWAFILEAAAIAGIVRADAFAGERERGTLVPLLTAPILTSVTVLLFCASPLLIGPWLRSSTIGKALHAVNPFSGTLNTFDAVIIDSDPFLSQLPRLALVLLGWLLATFLVARLAARRRAFR